MRNPHAKLYHPLDTYPNLCYTVAMNNIKALLTERGKSIYWLHKQVGMSYQAVHKLANAPAIPPGTTWGTLTRIAAALAVSVDELTKGGDGDSS